MLRQTVLDMYLEMGNQSQVAKELGISRQRVHQLLFSRSKEASFVATQRFLLREKIKKIRIAFSVVNHRHFSLQDVMDEAGIYRAFIHTISASGIKEEICQHPNYAGRRKKNKHLVWNDKECRK